MLAGLLLPVILSFPEEPKIAWTVATTGVGQVTADSVPIPRRTIVRKGQVIQIRGTVQSATAPPVNVNGSVFVRVGVDTRQQLNVSGPWSFDWNTGRESGNSVRLTVSYRMVGEETPTVIKTCDVTLVEAEPIRTSFTPSPDGSAKLGLSLGSGLTMEKPRVIVDGVEVACTFDSAGSATLTRVDLAGPGDDVLVQVTGAVSSNGNSVGVLSAPPLKIEAVHDLEIDESAVAPTHTTDPFETMIQVPFKSTAALKPGSAKLVIAGRAARGLPGDSSFNLDPRDVDPMVDQEVWMTAQDSKGRAVYSKKTRADALGLRDRRTTIETQLVKERERLRRVFTFNFGNRVTIDKDGKAHTSSVSNSSSIATGWDVLPGAEDRRPNAGRLSLVRTHVVHFYAPGTPDGQAQIGARFGESWKEPLSGAPIRKSVEDRAASNGWAEELSFLGPHHKKVAEGILDAMRRWAGMVDSAEAARQKAFRSQAYPDVVEFTARLNECEALRLEANRKIAEMELDLGLKPHGLTLTRWIVAPQTPDDTQRRVEKGPIDFPWWSQDLPLSMFP